MSLDDRKDTGLAEDNASETASRRRFLKVGAAAAVGAIAGAGALKTAEAQPETAGDVGVTNPDGTRVSPPAYNPSHPFNETLADAIVKAWGDPGRREQLLSDPKKTLGKDVIVLSRAQYHTGYVKTKNLDVYVLPDRPIGLAISLDTAKLMMQVTPFGM